MNDEQLVAHAAEMMSRAYAPYSGFRVGAALLDASGRVFGGCNVENASYGATICAERVAVCSAVAAGCTAFVRLAVISSGDSYCMPCGVCRQFLYEWSPDLTLLCARPDKSYLSFVLTELLPHAFGRLTEP